LNILILSAGGPASHGVIKSLKDINFDGKIVSVDSSDLSAGFYLSDNNYKVPNADDKRYVDALCEIVEKEKIDLILPTGGNDIISISKNSHLFKDKLFMSDYESIMDCVDKWRFYEKCKDKFPLPKTFKGSNLFKRPIMGSGSRGCELLEFSSDEIISEYLPGVEYTIDVLCDMDSNPLVVIPRERLETKAGISSKGRIVKDNFIEKACFDICKFLKLKGPICLQMKKDYDGNPKFIEINPRFGGGTYFTTLAGVNFVEIILDLFKGKKPIINEPKLITILRYFEEVVVPK
jgi:carbamoyl-phosphate synthase large subunit